jgi:hypothetical protein
MLQASKEREDFRVGFDVQRAHGFFRGKKHSYSILHTHSHIKKLGLKRAKHLHEEQEMIE